MAPLLKNLYNREYINLLSQNIKSYYEEFKSDEFIVDIFNNSWSELELKKRMRHIAYTLGLYLPQDYKESIEVLKNTFLQMNSAFNLENMIFQDYVELYGLDYFEISMNALEHFTINSSSEFAIRKFILKYPKETMQQMLLWSKSNNHHLRRLSSEGCRPRLPWAISLPAFKSNPSEVLEVILNLKDDESEYVRKSVANNLNDISKDNPHIVKELVNKWIGSSKYSDWILKHGCRTLLKSSDREVLNLFGFNEPESIKLTDLSIPKSVKMGEDLELSFSLCSTDILGKLRVEYILYFLRKNSHHNKKVFKLAEGDFKESSKYFSKKYSFKQISTRHYYRGLQKISIVVNGVEFTQKEFDLI